MNYLRKINRVRNYRIFRDYQWPSDLHPFAKVNVIYGGNGSGKTSLSTLLEDVASRNPISEGEFKFEFANGAVTGTDLGTANIPKMRVFNQQFVEATIRAVNDEGVVPIHYLGKATIEKQNEVMRLREELSKAKEEAARVQKSNEEAQKALRQFATHQAKTIKELLLGSPAHANYNRTHFERAVADMDAAGAAKARLTDEERERLRRERREQARPAVPEVRLQEPPLPMLTERTESVLKRTVLSQTLDELVQAPAVATWVQRGLPLHTGDHDTTDCRFCGAAFTSKRREELEGHFNDEFKRFTVELDTLHREIETAVATLDRITLPHEERIYDALREDYKAAVHPLMEATDEASAYLRSLARAVKQKQTEPFRAIALPREISERLPERHALRRAVEALNEIIDQHAQRTRTLNDRINAACRSLEQAAVADAFDEYNQLKGACPSGEVLRKALNRPREIEGNIEQLERTIVESRPAAEELTDDLRNYLGREELRFEHRDTGYVLLRRREPASHLSEGEKTAIAFLYFLKSLEDKDFNLETGVVVIDDPVSSLDANGLFGAFSYMKERTKKCGQLFILTHNFSFFRQIKNWVHHLPNQKKKDIERRPGRFFLLRATTSPDGHRAAFLGPIDPLLQEFESEYHFLFACVRREARRTDATDELGQLYGLPNIARRLLEAFLAFRLPHMRGNLNACLDEIKFNREAKARILRFLHTYSHADSIAEVSHNLNLLDEAPIVMKDLLRLIETVDHAHYKSLEHLCASFENAA